jgi:hypothetical protein
MFLVHTPLVFGQDNNERIDRLEQEVKQLRKQMEEEKEAKELEQLRRVAQEESAIGKPEEDLEKKEFRLKGLGLQKLNPEISIVGDTIFGGWYEEHDRIRSDALFRVLGVHFESYLDPYTKFKASCPVDPQGASLGEGYITRFGVMKNTSLTIGKFRQQFCTLNRWHKPGLDQIDHPLALRQIFGEGGLCQTGLSLDWQAGAEGGATHRLTFQATTGENPRLFGGNNRGTPSLLLRYLNYRDLTGDSYVEAGLCGLVGWSDTWAVPGDEVHDSEPAAIYGLELNYLWEPSERMRYRNFEWRTEAYYLDRHIVAPDGSGKHTVNAWGAFTSLQTKVSRTVDIGIHGDFYQPSIKKYADPSLFPHAIAGVGSAYTVQGGFYVTWNQSPWVRFRIQCDCVDSHNMGEPQYIVYFQITFAAGPHLHERY